MRKKILFVILDGYADDNEKTALMMASKPNMDMLTKNGFSGLLENSQEQPDSGKSTFALLGYPEEEYPGRGYLEALGAKIRITPGSVYIRANFASVNEANYDKYKADVSEPHLIVIDRRAGRDTSGLLEMSKDIKEFFVDGVRLDFYKSLGHRGVLAINSINASSNVSDSDPQEVNTEVLKIRPTKNDDESVKTAAALNTFSRDVYKILSRHPANKYRKVPANYILLRQAGFYKYVKSFKDKYGIEGACVAASPVVKGIARAMEMQVEEVSGATGDLKTDMKAKLLRALELLSSKDFVILHILGCDVNSHDKKANLGSIFIEKIDREIFGRILEYVNFDKNVVVVCSDHPTSSKTGKHIKGLMPFLIYTKGIESNKIQKLDEKSCKQGPTIKIENFMEEVQKFV